jgi:hypothetical protein
MSAADTNNRWYPTPDQVKDPAALERTLRQILKQHYDLQDRHNDLLRKVNAAPASSSSTASGPSNTKLCGLPVSPVDTESLADGATLKFDKKNGNFKFS